MVFYVDERGIALNIPHDPVVEEAIKNGLDRYMLLCIWFSGTVTRAASC